MKPTIAAIAAVGRPLNLHPAGTGALWIVPWTPALDRRGLEFPGCDLEAGLTGRSVDALRKTVSSASLETTHGGGVEIKLCGTRDEAFAEPESGTLVLVLGENLLSAAGLQTVEGENREFVGAFIDITDRISIAVDRGTDAPPNRMNEALIAMFEDRRDQAINAESFPFSIDF